MFRIHLDYFSPLRNSTRAISIVQKLLTQDEECVGLLRIELRRLLQRPDSGRSISGGFFDQSQQIPRFGVLTIEMYGSLEFWFCVWVTTQVKQNPALVVMRGGGVRVQIHSFRKLRQSSFQVELVRICNSKIQMCARRLGIQLNDLLEIADSLFAALHSRKYHAKHSQCLGILGSDLKRRTNCLFGLGKTRFPCENQAQV